MALTEIEYGAIASSSVMNGNFQYLDNRISSVVENNTSTVASISSNIASLNNSLTTLSNSTSASILDINTEISSLKSSLASNGLYVDTYVNGSSWYREYFSDAEKTTRVWVEQGGVATTNATTNLLKAMSDTNYTVVLGRAAGYYEAGCVSGMTTTSITLHNGKGYVYGCYFYVCGK